MTDTRYRSILIKFMSMKNGVTYGPNTVFGGEELQLVTPADVLQWINLRAYGTAVPAPDAKPVHARSSTLLFDKKAISSFMPLKHVYWDLISCRGNPTRSDVVNQVILDVKRSEVRHQGAKSQIRRPIEFDEFINILSILRKRPDRSCMVCSVLTLQWHLMARIDDMMKLRFSDFTPNVQQSSTLICKMRWSKNILEERERLSKSYLEVWILACTRYLV